MNNTQPAADEHEESPISQLSDNELYDKCQKYGQNSKIWTRKFAALLPEVEKRQLYRKKGFLSLFEFAKKLAGMSEFTVERILNLGRRLEDKPVLKDLFEKGEQGWGKMEKVSYVATPETDQFWAKKAETMSTRTLAAFVKEKRILDENNNLTDKRPDVGEPQVNLPIRQDLRYLAFRVNPNIEFKLRLYKQKLEKSLKKSLTWSEVFDELLNGKSKFFNNLKNTMEIPTNITTNNPTTAPTMHRSFSRQIPNKTREYLMAKYGHKCAFPGCNKPADIIHHTKRFAISKNHDPKDLVPLCDLHHNLVHTGCIANENDSPENWKFRDESAINELSSLVDKKILKFKAAI